MPFRLFLLFALLCGSTAFAGGGRGARQSLLVLHTNDTHSTIEPFDALLSDTLLAGRGGFLRRAALVERERRARPDLLLFDSGDFSHGSAYFMLFHGRVEIALMNLMGYDAATLGNHEFDFGVDTLAARIGEARFPFVCANYDFGTTPLASLVQPYVVIERNGLRIGVFGLSPDFEGLVSPANHRGVCYTDPVAAARKAVAQLRGRERCQLVVCLSHLGWNLEGEMSDSLLLSSVGGIDLLLGGHSHDYFTTLKRPADADGRPVPVNQNGKYGLYVGRMEIEMRRH